MVDPPLFIEGAISADIGQKWQVTKGTCDLIVILGIGYKLTPSWGLILRGVAGDTLVEPCSLNQEIRRTSRHILSVHFVIIGIQFIASKTKFVKNTITEFGPFMDKNFSRISISFYRNIKQKFSLIYTG